jgi:hypothetical protein
MNKMRALTAPSGSVERTSNSPYSVNAVRIKIALFACRVQRCCGSSAGSVFHRKACLLGSAWFFKTPLPASSRAWSSGVSVVATNGGFVELQPKRRRTMKSKFRQTAQSVLSTRPENHAGVRKGVRPRVSGVGKRCCQVLSLVEWPRGTLPDLWDASQAVDCESRAG